MVGGGAEIVGDEGGQEQGGVGARPLDERRQLRRQRGRRWRLVVVGCGGCGGGGVLAGEEKADCHVGRVERGEERREFA